VSARMKWLQPQMCSRDSCHLAIRHRAGACHSSCAAEETVKVGCMMVCRCNRGMYESERMQCLCYAAEIAAGGSFCDLSCSCR
jgi:hypothetical protein